MLQIKVPLEPERWDEEKEEFIIPKTQTLQLEHSLVSLSKWESKWNKPFITNNKKDKTTEEILDYIKCMTITQNVDPKVYDHLTDDNIKEIDKYIGNSMTATTFSDNGTAKANREVVTAEVIDYWMITLNIPSEYRKWHLNRLLTLIRVCNIKNSPQKKRSQRDVMRQNTELNRARRQRHNSRG